MKVKIVDRAYVTIPGRSEKDFFFQNIRLHYDKKRDIFYGGLVVRTIKEANRLAEGFKRKHSRKYRALMKNHRAGATGNHIIFVSNEKPSWLDLFRRDMIQLNIIPARKKRKLYKELGWM